ncbi:MAG TPA: hypothetical protein VMT29_13125 [Steroidobacteraceae bacterium]|nr:hypothetical protein [Steroidobacteraceae bacterium]
MSPKIALKLLAGAVALSLAGGALAANTSADANGTIFLNVVDTTQNTSFMFDTGVSVSTFNGDTSTYSHSIASDPNYQAFVAAEGTGDVINYSVVGTTNTADSFGNTPISLITAIADPASTTSGFQANDVATQIGSFLAVIKNPKGGSTFNLASGAPANDWARGGYEGSLEGDIGTVTDNAALNTPLAFYDVASGDNSATRGGATVTLLAHTWNLTSAGLLTYNVSQVPLPAPLVLLLSGLGLMGLLGRRGQRQADLGGALA